MFISYEISFGRALIDFEFYLRFYLCFYLLMIFKLYEILFLYIIEDFIFQQSFMIFSRVEKLVGFQKS